MTIVVLLGFVSACGVAEEPEPLTCETLTTPPPDCGSPCDSYADCEDSFCHNGYCMAECTRRPDEGCGANERCNLDGSCVPAI